MMRKTRVCLVVALCAASLASCNDSSPTSAAVDLSAVSPGRSFGIWTPGKTDTCSPDTHDRYATVGPDGKKYPTWHPPVDPATGCSFGHEHGRDPRGSALYRETGDMPFGYANEQLDVAQLGMQRHEDHVGHKVEWENDVQLRLKGGAGGVIELRCDVLVKLHQGTHSKDAFTNNLHELIYHLRCSDRTELHVTMLSAIGRPGEFVSSCGGTIHAGMATPANSPAGGGHRRLPDASCLLPRMLVTDGQQSDFNALHESWETHNEIRTADGKRLALFDPYFQVFRPSRYYDASLEGFVGRPVALCAVTIDDRRARGSECSGMSTTVDGVLQGLDYDDPQSRFNGVRRQVDVNNNIISNANGPTVWYSDPFGRNARPTPFPGSIRQVIARLDNNYGVGVDGPVLGGNRNYGGSGVRAPN